MDRFTWYESSVGLYWYVFDHKLDRYAGYISTSDQQHYAIVDLHGDKGDWKTFKIHYPIDMTLDEIKTDIEEALQDGKV